MVFTLTFINFGKGLRERRQATVSRQTTKSSMYYRERGMTLEDESVRSSTISFSERAASKRNVQ